MPSYVVHYTVSELLLDRISKSYRISDYQKNYFRCGNLIVDSLKGDYNVDSCVKEEDRDSVASELFWKKQEEKNVTHFREDGDYVFRIPDMDKFIKKYDDLLKKDFSVLGYLFHLYTDRVYFTELMNKTVMFLDGNLERTYRESESVYVEVIRTGKRYFVDSFWAGSDGDTIYDEYTRLCKYVIETFHIHFDKKELKKFAKENFVVSKVEEVDYRKIGEVLDAVDGYIQESYEWDSEFRMFLKNDIEEFIHGIVERFIEEYGFYFDCLFLSN